MAIGYDPYGDNSGNLYQRPDVGTDMTGQPWGQPQPIDQSQGGGIKRQTTDPNAPGYDPGVAGWGPGQVLGGMQQQNSQFGYNPNAGMGGSMASGVGSNPFITPNVTQDQISSYFASRGVTPNASTPGYFAQKWPELYARGQQLGNPNYAMQRLQFADEFLPGGPSSSPFYEAPQGGSIGGTGTGQIASVNPSQSGGTVAPTWTAMLNSGSAYKRPDADPNSGAIGTNGQGLTLAQLLGGGGISR